jgi:hypothetical protein
VSYDPNDLTHFKGPVWKKPVEGGIGKKKPAKNQVRKQASPKSKQRVRDKKVTGCRVCPNTDGLALHAHHIVREGSPWFGQFTENNICGLCAECHHGLHAGDDRVKKILRARLTDTEVQYGDERAYPGYVDDIYWRLRRAGANPGTLAEDAA